MKMPRTKAIAKAIARQKKMRRIPLRRASTVEPLRQN
jgi:hypothetical protein